MAFFGIGAPAAAAVVDTLAALGTRRFLNLGAAGGLQPGARVGELVVCNNAVRDEGLSHHYLAPARYASPSARLTDALIRSLKAAECTFNVGSTWTIDAPFRETVEELRHYRDEGVLTVEMEAAAVFAVAEHRGFEAAAAFVLSDVLSDADWTPDFGSLEIQRGLTVLVDAAIEVIEAERVDPGPDPRVLSLRQLNRTTLARQLLLERAALPVAGGVERLVGMQAQLARPPFVGLWTRLADFRREDLANAIDHRQIVKATFLRGTLHLLTADDYLKFRATLQPGADERPGNHRERARRGRRCTQAGRRSPRVHARPTAELRRDHHVAHGPGARRRSWRHALCGADTSPDDPGAHPEGLELSGQSALHAGRRLARNRPAH